MAQNSQLHKFIKEHPLLAGAIYAAAISALILIWMSLFAPNFKKLNDNFTYSANILSLDNFYDAQAHQFEGQHISKTTFSFEVVSKQPSYLIIKNLFAVRKLSDKPIFSVSRYYYINPYDGRHVYVDGRENRSGYLFAPHYVLRKPFYYWHINYNAPALMKFIDKESINGLTVYHYAAHYLADQTANLTYLPGVPEKRGIKTDVNLQLWVEPITGWLIKYQDNTLAYYYDRKTGQRLEPWNSFTNRYTQSSINEKVAEATILKWKFLFIDFGVPLLIFISPLLILFHSALQRYYRVILSPILNCYAQLKADHFIHMLFFLLIVSSVGTLYYVFWYKGEPSTFKIGISQWNNNAELLSAIKGFKDGLAENGFQEGKNIEFIIKNPNSNVLNQVNIIQFFVKNKVDVIFTLTTPGTLVAKGITSSIPIVFTDVSYPVESGIISDMQSNKTNLVGTLNYVSPAEQFFRFDVMYPSTKILGFIHQKGDPDSEIQYQEYKEMLARRNIEVMDIPAIDFDDMRNQLQLQLHHIDALFVACDTLIRNGGGNVAAQYSRNNKIPSFTCDKDSVVHGIMVGYFADLYSIGKQAGVKVALILRGANPDWLHTEFPSHDYLMVNKSTAQLLGITIPLNELQKSKFDYGK